MSPSYVHTDYTVAWISALPLELTAAKSMLDETHPRLPQSPSDRNTYTLGSIGGHNVVMACLPAGSIGTNAAAAVVVNMRSTFAQIQYGLMVGIGGGAPSEKNDIRLGDVAVSTPTGVYGGVVQYDFGKVIAGGEFQHTGTLNRPPEVLLTSLSKLQADHNRETSPIRSVIQGRLVRKDLVDTYGFPGLQKDILFEGAYEHVQSNEICTLCDVGKIARRDPRKSSEPMIHYGLIASGNQVIKNGTIRDMLSRKYGILCFEMEAAGLMNQLPSLVIRGICDYSDSHKHAKWQGYAAMTAAAYARSLLMTVPLHLPARVAKKRVMSAEERRAYQSLFLTDPEDDMNSLKRRKGVRAPGTCEWYLETNEMLRWLKSKPSETDISNMCWLYGSPGTGKSTMAITLIEKLPEKDLFINGNAHLAYFFCDSGNEVQRTAISVLRGLLYQLIKSCSSLIDFIMPRYQAQQEKAFTSFDALWAMLLAIGRESGQAIYCIIDALDECDTESQKTLLTQFNVSFHGRNWPELHILVTSRPYEEIRRDLCHYPGHNLAHFGEVHGDLATLIESKVQELSRRNRYTSSVRDEISAILKERAEGTFLWVGIACDQLKETRARDAVLALRSLPQSLSLIYQKLLDTALEQPNGKTEVLNHILSFVAVACRPLSPLELAEACQLYESEEKDDKLMFMQDDIDLCRLLIVIDDDKVFLLHKSVKDFLLNDQSHRIMDELSAHANLAYRCIDRVLSAYELDKKGNGCEDTTEFLQYSAENWPEHARKAASAFKVQRRHVEFFQVQSWPREWWLDYLRGLYLFDLSSDIPFNFSIFHVAARWGIPQLIPYVLSQRDRMHHDYLNSISSDGRTPLDESASRGHPKVFNLLLDMNNKPGKIRSTVVEAAVSNVNSGKELLCGLLDRKNCEIEVTQDTVITAAQCGSEDTFHMLLELLDDSLLATVEAFEAMIWNKTNGPEMMKLVIDRLGPHFLIHQGIVETVARQGNAKLMSMILDWQRESLKITEETLHVLMHNKEDGVEIMKLLLHRIGHMLPISEGLDLFCSYSHNPRLALLILNQLREERIPGIELWLASRRNSPCRNHDLDLSLFKGKDWIPVSHEALIVAATCANPELMKLLLNETGALELVTEEVVKEITVHGDDSMLQLLLDRLGQGLPISERIVDNAVQNRRGLEMLKQLISIFGDSLLITEAVFESAACGFGCVSARLNLLLSHFKHKLHSRDQIFKFAVLARMEFNDLEAFLAFIGEEMSSAEIEFLIERVASSEKVGFARLVLDYYGDKAVISEAALVEAARNSVCGRDMTQLFQRHRGRISLTHELIRMAASNSSCGRETLQLLFRDQERFCPVPQDLIDTAAFYASDEQTTMMSLLLAYGNRIFITEDILSRIVGSDSYEVLWQLLQRDQAAEALPITEEVLESLFKNHWCGERMLLLLLDNEREGLLFSQAVEKTPYAPMFRIVLDRLRDRLSLTEHVLMNCARMLPGMFHPLLLIFERQYKYIAITQDVFRQAACYGDSRVVSAILAHCPELQITRYVLLAAARNYNNGKQVLQLLLSNHGARELLTPEVIATAIVTRPNGQIVSFLLGQFSNRFSITEEILVAAASSYRAMKIVFGQGIDHRLITEKVLIAAAESGEGHRILHFLRAKVGYDLNITENVFVAAAFSYGKSWALNELSHDLVSSSRVSVSITIAAASNNWEPFDAMQTLLNWLGDRLPVTEAVLSAAASNFKGRFVIDLLLNHPSAELSVTREVVLAAVGKATYRAHPLILKRERRSRDARTIMTLLQQRKDEVVVTEGVLFAALENTVFSYALDIITSLTTHKQEEVRHGITDNLLLTAAGGGNLDILRFFARRFNITIRDEWIGICQLYVSTCDGNSGAVKTLIEKGTPPDTKNASNETPLWQAAFRGYHLVIRELLRSGRVNVNALSVDNISPLMVAAAGEHTAAVHLLLQAGADPHLASAKGDTAFSLTPEGNLRIRSILEEHGATERLP